MAIATAGRGARGSGLVRAGVARVDITPALGSYLAGFAARTSPATGVHDPLGLRAVAVSHVDDRKATSVLLVADLLALDIQTVAQWGVQVANHLAISPEQVSISVTHTHGGPAISARHLGGGADSAYLRRLADAAVECADRAVKAQSPAIVHTGRAELFGVAHNRRPSESIVDPAVHVVALRRPGGGLLGVLFSHACHPVVLGPDNQLVTADWPGFACAHLERNMGAPTVFAQGCAGQINTGHTAEDSLQDTPSSRRTFAEADRIGRLVAAAATRAVRSALRHAGIGDEHVTPATVRIDCEPVPLPFQTARAGAPVAPVTLHQWANARVLCLPGEPFVELALDTRTAVDDPNLVVLGYTGGVPGYVAYPPELYANGGYEICQAHHFYGQPDAFAPEAGLALRAAADRLLAATGQYAVSTNASNTTGRKP